MVEWSVGDPGDFSTESGPVINEKAYRKLISHADEMHDIGQLIYKHPTTLQGGWFFSPKVYELKEANHLNIAAFGPILHLVRFKRENIKSVIKQLSDQFPGLTLNIQSTIHSFCNDISTEVKSDTVVINGLLKNSMCCYYTGSLEKRLNYLRNFVLEKTIFVVR